MNAHVASHRPPSLPVKRWRTARRGATVVETAVVMPIFILFVFALLCYGHAHMVQHMMRNAVRGTARLAACEGVTQADVDARFRQLMRGVIDPAAAELVVKDASAIDQGGDYSNSGTTIGNMPDFNFNATTPGQLFVIYASVPYNDVNIIPMPWMDGVTLSAAVYMRHE